MGCIKPQQPKTKGPTHKTKLSCWVDLVYLESRPGLIGIVCKFFCDQFGFEVCSCSLLMSAQLPILILIVTKCEEVMVVHSHTNPKLNRLDVNPLTYLLTHLLRDLL